ncbi:MAG: hypothetical protein RIS85_2237 [Pseudomonadota bacterium]
MARPTIKDIAAKAGVSFKTVSRVLNGYTSVAEDLRERVDAAMRELDYRPNQAARQMRGRKAFAIALIPALRDDMNELGKTRRMPSYLSDVITGMIQACQEADYRLLVETLSSTDDDSGRTAFERFLDCTRVDGVLLVPPLCDDPWLLDQLAARRIQMARLNPGTRHDLGFCTIIDNHAAAGDVIRHLTDHGHRHLAYIKGPALHRAQIDRTRGVMDACAEHDGIRLDIRQGDFLFDSGQAVARELLSLKEPPTAIFAANDEMAAGALAAAIELGFKVPETLSIVGFGGLHVSEMTWPRLTTVHQPTVEMARNLSARLIEQAGDDDQAASSLTMQPYHLIARQSVTAPAG